MRPLSGMSEYLGIAVPSAHNTTAEFSDQISDGEGDSDQYYESRTW